MSLLESIKKSYREGVESARSRQQARNDETARIKSGDIKPIETDLELEKGENVYGRYRAERLATVMQQTSERKGVLGRALVGGLFLGPLGALGGAVTSGSETKTKELRPQVVDKGVFYITDHRLLFVGKEIVSIPFGEVLGVRFNKAIMGSHVVIKYEGMQKNESYNLTGSGAREAGLYYEGMQKLRKRSHIK